MSNMDELLHDYKTMDVIAYHCISVGIRAAEVKSFTNNSIFVLPPNR